MRKWLIKRLGGYTHSEVEEKVSGHLSTITSLNLEVAKLKAALRIAQKNDYRDPVTKRFIKAPIEEDSYEITDDKESKTVTLAKTESKSKNAKKNG